MLTAYDHIWHRGADGAPVLVLFHGTGSGKEDIAGLAQHIDADASYLAMDGDVMEGPMRRFFRRTGEGVYDMTDFARATAKMAGFLEAAFAEYGITYAVGIGYSNGANILANLSLTGQGPLRRAVLMHPLTPHDPDWPDLSDWQVLITAGNQDPICPLPLTERLIAGYRAAGADVEAMVLPGGHGLQWAELDAARRFVAGDT
ncbi:phospholipase/carboxylesterase [Rubricella aquisinus]|uniref:Phospholipase/carboxylesterase n=1 Tax=Rubricella aquisinus TaxID=2028108 RepID=A0A840WP45_9RHOB|nr:alpha/beta hydrolase [Rubricella aquisinus]MBB5515853.1 phospholipase/carboxylesterase [Rubricella aquisinus]